MDIRAGFDWSVVTAGVLILSGGLILVGLIALFSTLILGTL